MRETAEEMGVKLTPQQLEGLVDLQMQAIRGMVTNIDVGGRPKGGNA
jgi:hypothetical protein